MHRHDEEYLVEFELRGFNNDPTSITENLNIQPSFTLKQGQKILHKRTGKVLRTAAENRWKLNSALSAGADVQEQFITLLDLLRPHKEYIKSVLKTGKCLWLVSGRSYKESGQVGINLPAQILMELCDYNAELDIDIYAHDK